MRTYSTADVSPAARVRYWNDLHGEVFSPVEFLPASWRDFSADIRVDGFGPLMISRHRAEPATIDHTARHAASCNERRIALLMPTSGGLLLSHYGRDSWLRDGDFALVDHLAPLRLSFGCTNVSLRVGIPDELLLHNLPGAESMFGLPIRGDRNFGSMIVALLEAAWTQTERGLPPEFRHRVARSLLDMLATAFALEHGASIASSALAGARRAQIRRYVEANLSDSSLSPRGIATAVGLSPRYVRSLFAVEGESLSAYVMRRRLEECAHQLSSPQWRARSITDTAFAWGFCSMPHFTRAFKARFGVTPREFRKSHETS